MLLAGDRLTLRATANKPREITYERDGKPFATLRLFAVGSEPTLALDDGRTYEIRGDDRFELTHPDEGPRIAWRTEGGFLRRDRICLHTGEHYDLKVKGSTATLKDKRRAIARMEMKGSTAITVLEAQIEADELDELVLAAATSVFLELRPRTGKTYSGESPKAGDSYGIHAAATSHGPG